MARDQIAENTMAAPDCVFQVGDNWSEPMMFTEQDIQAVALLVGDPNPVHHDLDLARGTRFGGLIASGSHVAAMMGGAVARFITSRGAGLGTEIHFDLKKAVRANIAMTASWTVVRIEPDRRPNCHRVEFEGRLMQDDDVLVVGSVRCIASRETFF